MKVSILLPESRAVITAEQCRTFERTSLQEEQRMKEKYLNDEISFMTAPVVCILSSRCSVAVTVTATVDLTYRRSLWPALFISQLCKNIRKLEFPSERVGRFASWIRETSHIAQARWSVRSYENTRSQIYVLVRGLKIAHIREYEKWGSQARHPWSMMHAGTYGCLRTEITVSINRAFTVYSFCLKLGTFTYYLLTIVCCK